jgi:formylglycine-generating enzyme required for sulfatase activity
MREMIEVRGPGVAAELAEHPVTKAEFRSYVRAVGRRNPPPLAPGERSSDPVTYVSRDDAVAFCQWLSTKEGRTYRLPRIAELSELAGDAASEGVSLEIWPHTYERRPELRGGLKPDYLCEWTQETETVPLPGGRVRVLGSVFYPPWLRHGANASHQQACLLASEGYSFVTFRVASDL